MTEKISEQLKGVKIDMAHVKEVGEHDKKASKEAHERLDHLEDIVGKKYPQSYRDAFVTGYIEASWIARTR